MISFLDPVILYCLFLIPLAFMFLQWRQRYYLQRFQLIASGDVVKNAWKWQRHGIYLAICILLIIALARPVWGTELEAVETQGVSIIFALDVSKSMDAQDVLPSRLERAKLSLGEILKQLSGNELGLILFAGNAIVKFPLTTDTLSATTLVKQITTNSISAQGTNIEQAIQLSLQSLASASKGKHIIVMLTDGENHDGEIDSVIAASVQADVTIYTIGYGDAAGALIPIYNPDGSISDKRDEKGNQVRSSLDEKILKTLAESTGGTYFHAVPNSDEVPNLIKSINQYLPYTLNRGVQAKSIERFDIFVTLAAILLTILILPTLPNSKSSI